jgi:hypothetical protein
MEGENVFRVLVGKGIEATCKNPRVDGNIILRWIFRKRNVGVWTASIWLRIGTVGGHLCVRE